MRVGHLTYVGCKSIYADIHIHKFIYTFACAYAQTPQRYIIQIMRSLADLHVGLKCCQSKEWTMQSSCIYKIKQYSGRFFGVKTLGFTLR